MIKAVSETPRIDQQTRSILCSTMCNRQERIVYDRPTINRCPKEQQCHEQRYDDRQIFDSIRLFSLKIRQEMQTAPRYDHNHLKRERTRDVVVTPELHASHSNRPALIEYAYPFHSQRKTNHGTVRSAHSVFFSVSLSCSSDDFFSRVDADEPAQAKKLVVVNNQGRKCSANRWRTAWCAWRMCFRSSDVRYTWTIDVHAFLVDQSEDKERKEKRERDRSAIDIALSAVQLVKKKNAMHISSFRFESIDK